MGICALCSKKMEGIKYMKGITCFELFGKELCADCYGYASLLCRGPEDLEDPPHK